jgi:hypothetical protein
MQGGTAAVTRQGRVDDTTTRPDRISVLDAGRSEGSIDVIGLAVATAPTNVTEVQV